MSQGNENPYATSCLSIDLEVGRADGKIHKLAGVRGDCDASFSSRGEPLSRALEQLDELSQGAKFLLGHNLTLFDVPQLQAASPGLRLLRLPLVDTLFLNPLAFPRNPYHHLVKHYQDGQLQGGKINDPELDARLTLSLFFDQCQSFTRVAKTDPELLALWHYLSSSNLGGTGYDLTFSAIRHQVAPNRKEALDLLASRLEGAACSSALLEIADEIQTMAWPIAFALAWISVAGSDSSMPPWVLYQFPEATVLIARLRDNPCSDRDCRWCATHHDTRGELKKWFGFENFRSDPTDAMGIPLQEVIVAKTMTGRHVLGILPTGSGKSVCYQLPALSRYDKTGALTVIISPLVALMADQVAGLEARGISSCGAINGMLSMPERAAVLEDVRLGKVSMLLISPEQLRSKTVQTAISQRMVGSWVLDEAHCLSKWGHDFRPDYRYIARFIQRQSRSDNYAPILCLTATAKPDVIEDVVSYFVDRLGIKLEVINGGAERKNLNFQVIPTSRGEKFRHLHEIITHYLPKHSSGGAIVYCATRAHAEAVAKYLNEKQLPSAFYHAGLLPESKKSVQNSFIGGEIRVIVATNAFGMGIDKPDVRLVVHADIPGSLENYLQEAGRAGRDRASAYCILLYDPQDVESQFSLSARSRLTRGEIDSVLRALRRVDRKRQLGGEVIVTPGEILTEETSGEFERDDLSDDTRVRIAVAWLEEAKLLMREENRVSIFPSSLQVASLEHARHRLAKEKIPGKYREQLLGIVALLLNADPVAGISTDSIATSVGLGTPGVRRAFGDLERLGIASNDIVISAFVNKGVKNSSLSRLQSARGAQHDLIDILIEEGGNVEIAEAAHLNLRGLTQALKNSGHKTILVEQAWRLLNGLSRDRSEQNGRQNGAMSSFSIRRESPEYALVIRNREWSEVKEIAQLRVECAAKLLAHLLSKIPNSEVGTDLLGVTTLGQLAGELTSDLMLSPQIPDVDRAVERALIWLHELNIVRLNRGLTVYRPAMTIRLNDETRPFASHDFAPLAIHYSEKTLQIHVMAEYATVGSKTMTDALALAMDYFALDREEFLDRWLPARPAELKRQTTAATWKRIVEDLGDPTQKRIVADDREETNRIVLAGPGSGKTRVLVHRIAYLVRVRQENPYGIIALAYNHHAASEIRKRLFELIGDDARRVRVMTIHGLAMRLTGAAFSAKPDKSQIDFKAILKDAAALLLGESDVALEPDELRDILLGGYRWILVDEYQDIDADQYALISALTGRTLRGAEQRLTIFAVGDDDQNIYEFNGASVEFIRRFEQDFKARPTFLIDNYRSTPNIIAAANRLIESSPDRMKVGHPIQINKARAKMPQGGDFELLDPVAKGRVQVLGVGADRFSQATALVNELLRLSERDPDWDWSQVAIIARNWKDLNPIRAFCELRGIPAQLANSDVIPFWSLRETQALIAWLRSSDGLLIDQNKVLTWLGKHDGGPGWDTLEVALLEYFLGSGPSEHYGKSLIEWIAEWGRDPRRRYQGMLLTTAHGAKGLEFDHVAVLDGAWVDASGQENLDAARRLYYVAATRAKKTLLFGEMNRRQPLLANLRELGSVVQRDVPNTGKAPPELRREYLTLSLADVDLGFAGRHSPQHRIHEVIAALAPGDALAIELESRTIRNSAGTAVGRLARGFQAPAAMSIIRSSVAAIVTRSRETTDEDFRDSLQCDFWEVVVPEVVFAPIEAAINTTRRAHNDVRFI